VNVYLVEVDNGESYEDHRHWITKVFTTYRGASQWLINEEYKPYSEFKWTENGKEMDLYFYWQESDEYMAESSFAKIYEMELEEE
jgi:hypothetical protein